MKITIETKEVWKIDFTNEEMMLLKDLSNTVGIPLYTFGGLSTDSPWVRVKAEKAMEIINANISLTDIYDSTGIDKYVKTIKKSPSSVAIKVRKTIINYINKYIPKGFFIAK